jgi:DNA-directed RNA polymerase subunit RPC12/RpoP
MMEFDWKVLYVYRCMACGHRGEFRLADHSHDGESASCDSCGGPVPLEWDGGVKLSTTKERPGFFSGRPPNRHPGDGRPGIAGNGIPTHRRW